MTVTLVDRKKKPILESQTQKQFKEWLDKQTDLKHWKTNDQYTRGVSDIPMCLRGLFVAIELKVPGKEPTALQLKFINDVIDAGGIACWCDTVKKCISVVETVRHYEKEIKAGARLRISTAPDRMIFELVKS